MSDDRFTLETLEACIDAIQAPRDVRPEVTLLSPARYQKCRRGEHELAFGVCMHCYTPVSPK